MEYSIRWPAGSSEIDRKNCTYRQIPGPPEKSMMVKSPGCGSTTQCCEGSTAAGDHIGRIRRGVSISRKVQSWVAVVGETERAAARSHPP